MEEGYELVNISCEQEQGESIDDEESSGLLGRGETESELECRRQEQKQKEESWTTTVDEVIWYTSFRLQIVAINFDFSLTAKCKMIKDDDDFETATNCDRCQCPFLPSDK